jgi:hypothetical protein
MVETMLYGMHPSEKLALPGAILPDGMARI